jgi:hypothetical protein
LRISGRPNTIKRRTSSARGGGAYGLEEVADILIAIGEWIIAIAYLVVAVGFAFGRWPIRSRLATTRQGEVRQFIKEVQENLDRTSETMRNWEKRLK